MIRSTGEKLSGFFVLDKEAGFTSQDAVRAVSKKLLLEKAGHSGTLDRFATGVLPVLSGRYTRLMRFFMEGPKSYRATIAFGQETDTLDPEGKIIREAPLPNRPSVEAALPAFRGDIMQEPPLYSALHVDGKRAWKRALSGEDIRLPSRPVSIHRLELLSWEEGRAEIEVDCSKGTYIRSLARDIALASGSAGHLSALRRTMAAGLREGEALPLDAMERTNLRRLDEAMSKGLGLSLARIREDQSPRILNGKQIPMDSFESIEGDGPLWAVFSAGSFLALMKGLGEGKPAYEAVIGDGE